MQQNVDIQNFVFCICKHSFLYQCFVMFVSVGKLGTIFERNIVSYECFTVSLSCSKREMHVEIRKLEHKRQPSYDDLTAGLYLPLTLSGDLGESILLPLWIFVPCLHYSRHVLLANHRCGHLFPTVRRGE